MVAWGFSRIFQCSGWLMQNSLTARTEQPRIIFLVPVKSRTIRAVEIRFQEEGGKKGEGSVSSHSWW